MKPKRQGSMTYLLPYTSSRVSMSEYLKAMRNIKLRINSTSHRLIFRLDAIVLDKESNYLENIMNRKVLVKSLKIFHTMLMKKSAFKLLIKVKHITLSLSQKRAVI